MTTGLVGQFGADGWYRARPVELEGQPSWTLGQLWAMWSRRFRRDTAQMVAALLERDWSVLACTEWPARAMTDEPHEFRYVNGVGRGLLDSRCGRLIVANLGLDEPQAQWAYLWERQFESLHVYVGQRGRWHHVATLDADVWAGLTKELVMDVEARKGWLEGSAE